MAKEPEVDCTSCTYSAARNAGVSCYITRGKEKGFDSEHCHYFDHWEGVDYWEISYKNIE